MRTLNLLLFPISLVGDTWTNSALRSGPVTYKQEGSLTKNGNAYFRCDHGGCFLKIELLHRLSIWSKQGENNE